MNLEQRLDQVEEIIKRPGFRENKGLGNEVGYYIFDYPAEKELLVRERIQQIADKNKKSHDLYSIKVFDLYEIIINTLIEKGFFDKCVEFEKEKGMERIVKAIANTMRITSPESLIIKHIKDNITENTIIFITGVGKCFPILRSHNVLNNLHQIIDSVPVVMFYPGIYSGQELILFSEIKDDNYYRAFKLVD